MPVTQNLYQIYKLTSTQIVEANLEIKDYTRYRAIKDGALVSIGDNMVFQKIRDYYGDTRTHIEIFERIQELRKTLRLCKKAGKINEAKIVNQQISDVLFVKDIISVEAKTKGQYNKLAKKGFKVNGIHFVHLGAGAGNIRKNVAFFINKEVEPFLREALMCGLDGKIKEINLAKLGAYFALSLSSVLWVRTPRVCVIKDFETVIPKQKVDWICSREDGSQYVEEREIDIPLNSADGQGLVDPEFSKLWAQDMQIDWIPSSFVVRSAFVKGNLVPFDFKEYAKRNGISTITDRWGKNYPIEEIDVLLSESQFKMYKLYSHSWQEYLEYFERYELKWGVSRYNRKYDDEYVLTNYQYIQTLDLTAEDIDLLIKPTVDWIKNICSGDELYALLFSLGAKDDDIEWGRYYGTAQANWTKAIVKNKEFLKDSYVQHKIYQSVVECINRAKLGKIWVRGNYQFAISDPVAQCRNALGLNPMGLIPADNIYSNFWRERRISGYVDVCRSPMIDAHEHNPSKLFESEEANYWYQYIKSGVIFSIYDIAVMRMEDSDLTLRSFSR